jgi:predicted  nucleic acid-binding Zn-ribbon protein
MKNLIKDSYKRLLLKEAAEEFNIVLKKYDIKELQTSLLPIPNLTGTKIGEICKGIETKIESMEKFVNSMVDYNTYVEVVAELNEHKEEYVKLDKLLNELNADNSTGTATIAQLKTKITNLENTITTKELVIKGFEGDIEKLNEQIVELTELNTVLNSKVNDLTLSQTDLQEFKNTKDKIDTWFINLIEEVFKYYHYAIFRFGGEVNTKARKLHEIATKPFLFTLALLTVEAIVIHTYFWGSTVLAFIILAVLNILAYADRNSVLAFVRYEGLKKLKEMKVRAIAMNVEFNPSFDLINSIYKANLKHTFGVVNYLAVITTSISLIQFLYYGYHYDHVSDNMKLQSEATLTDLLNQFRYVYTYKNLLISGFMGFLAHYTITVSVILELPKIYNEIIEKLEN